MGAAFNTANMGLCDAVAFCQNSLLFSASPDRGNLPVRKPAIPVVRSVVMAALNACVSIIFGLCPNSKMGRVNTGRVVADVHDNHTVRNWAYKILVGVPVGTNGNLPRHQKNAISVVIKRALPKPALGGLFDAVFKYVLRPKYGVILKFAVRAGAIVARAAEFAAYGPLRAASHAIQFSSNLVCHRQNLLCGAPIICYNHGVG